MLLIIFLLVLTALSITGYGISRYKEDYYTRSLRTCNILTSDILRHNEENPAADLFAEYIPYATNSTANELDILLYIFDTDGQCLVCSDNTGQKPEEVRLSTEMLLAIQKNGSYMTDRISGKFNRTIAEPLLCKGNAFTIQRNGDLVTYYLFANAHTQELSAYITDVIKMTVIFIVVVLIVASLLILYSIRLKNQPLTQILEVLRLNARGDYSKRLEPDQYSGTEYEEITALMCTISDQSERAEESSRQFVSNVSHELRTPMTIISGFVEGILDGTIPKNKRMEYLSIVSQEVQRLKMLVTSMLNLTKFDHGTIQIHYQLFTLNDTAFRTVLMFENRLNKRHITVEGLDSPPVRVCADPDLIGQVIYNLVENAVKFVDDNGTISFSFTEEENEWSFSIRNTGRGISKEELPKIFERFYKSDASRSQDKTGLGLGLDIIKQIIHLHNAQISVRSEENAYTEFEVRLPHVEPPHTEQEHDTKESH